MKKTFCHLILIVSIGITVYSNTFRSPFVLDDWTYIIENPQIKNLFNSLDIFDARYVTYLTFALNYSAGGFNTEGYHIVNLIIHLISALLVYSLVSFTFRTPFLRNHDSSAYSDLIALSAALIFVSHPVQTQAVTYIAQRFASLATMFYLVSLVLYIKWRLISEQRKDRAEEQKSNSADKKNTSALLRCWSTGTSFYCGSLFSAILAMKTKEIAFTLPFIIILYEFSFFNEGHESDTRRSKLVRFFYIIPFLLTMLIIPMSIIGPELGIYTTKSDTLENLRQLKLKEAATLSAHDYLATQFRVILTYLRLLLFPVNQNLLYDYPIFKSFSNPEVYLSFIFLFLLFCTGLYLFHLSRTRYYTLRLAGFGIIWFFITMSVESSLIPIKDVIFEHRVYLPSIGIIIALTTASFYFLQPKLRTEHASSKAVHLLFGMIILSLSVATYYRNSIWRDEFILWMDVVKKSPNRGGAHMELGNVYTNMGLMDEAIKEYRKSIDIKPNSDTAAAAHNNIGLIYVKKGKSNEAIEEYKTALEIKPDFDVVHNNLGNAYYAIGDLDKAAREYEAVLLLRPDAEEVHYNLGLTYQKQGLVNKAVHEYLAAIRLKPDYAKAHSNLGSAYLSMGLTDNAISHFKAALEHNPNLSGTHNNLGLAYKQKGLVDEAIKEFQAALNIQPGFIQAQQNLESMKK